MNFEEFKDFQFKNNISFNAYTGPSTMGLSAEGHCSDTYTILEILLEMAFEPTFEQSILDRETEIVLREITERRGDPSYKLHYLLQNQAFTPESLVNHEVLGSAEAVASTSLEDLYRLFRDSISRSHIVLEVAGGGFENNELTAKVKQILQIA